MGGRRSFRHQGCRALQHETIPPQPNFSTPSPDIDLEASRLFIPIRPLPWPRQKAPRRAGVNGFGFGGTNAHLIVEEFDAGYHADWKKIVQPETPPPGDDVVVVGVGIVRPDGGALNFDVANSSFRSENASCRMSWKAWIAAKSGHHGRRPGTFVSRHRVGGMARRHRSHSWVRRARPLIRCRRQNVFTFDRIKRRLSHAISDDSAMGGHQQIISRLLEAVASEDAPVRPVYPAWTHAQPDLRSRWQIFSTCTVRILSSTPRALL